jgi:hypothetical protein
MTLSALRNVSGCSTSITRFVGDSTNAASRRPRSATQRWGVGDAH